MLLVRWDPVDIMGGWNFLSPSHPLTPEFLMAPFPLQTYLVSSLHSLARKTERERMAVDLLPSKVTVSEVCLFHKLLFGFRDGGCISILCLGNFLSKKNCGESRAL